MRMRLIKEIIFFSFSPKSFNEFGFNYSREVVEKLKKIEGEIKINSLEGYFRQIAGWREFIKGVYQSYDKEFEKNNFFNHKRLMKKVGMMDQQESYLWIIQ